MMTIQSNEFKTHFSGILRQVESGQEVIISRHKKIVAKLTPYNKKSNSKEAVDAMKKIRYLDLSQDEVSEYRKSGQR